MKKLFFFVLAVKILLAEITVTTFNAKNFNLLFNDNKYINVSDNGMLTNLPYLSHKITPEIAIKTIKKTDEDQMFTYEYDNVKFKDLLSYLVFHAAKAFNNDDSGFMNDDTDNKTSVDLYVDGEPCKLSKSDEELNSPVLGDIDVLNYTVSCRGDTALSVDLYKNVPVYVSVKGEEFSLKAIHNKYTQKYLQLKKTLKLSVTSINFNSPVWATFEVKENNEVNFLNVKFKMENSQNRLYSITLKGKLNDINPMQKYGASVMTRGYFINYENKVFEWQKIMAVDDSPVMRWKFENGTLEMVYLDENNKQITKSILPADMPYDITGIWAVVMYMDKNGINNMRVSFITNTLFNGKIIKESPHTYHFFAKTGDTVMFDYKFVVDKYSKIIKIEDKKYNKNYFLKNAYLSDEVLNNRKKLEEFKKEYSIKEINE